MRRADRWGRATLGRGVWAGGRRWGRGALAGLGVAVALAAGGIGARPAVGFAQEQASGELGGPGRVVVSGVEVRGNDRVQEAVIVSEAQIRAGDTITYFHVQRAMRRLWATGQFKDVKILAREEGGEGPVRSAALVIEVEEQPFISAIEFRGLEHVKGSTIRDTAKLKTGVPLQPSRVAEATAMIRQLLAKQGIQAEKVEHRVEPIEGRPGEHRLVFDVKEGQRVAIAEVEFRGNQAFSDAELRKAIDTKPEGFLWFRSGTYDEDRLRKDLREKLPAFYAERGYIDFTVRSDSLVVDPETGKARLVIEVSEGPQYRLAGFDVRGNRRFSSDELKRYFEQRGGGLLQSLGLGKGSKDASGGPPVFDHAAFEKATEQVKRLYSNQGYLYAQVVPVVERTTDAAGNPVVNVAWEIREGEPAYVKSIAITGNTYTHEDVIRERILLLPGDVYSEEALIQSYQNIMALGFFETPLPYPQIQPDENGDVNITFEVKEKQTGSINFGTAIGGYGGVSGFLGYDQPNLFGRAKAGHLRAEWGQWSKNFEASYSDPAIMGSRVSGSISLFSGSDRFIQFSEGRRVRTGAAWRVGLPLPFDRWRRTRLMLGYSIARTSYEEFDDLGESGIFSLPPGLQSTISLGLVRSTLNHNMFPTAGTRQEIQAEFNGGILGGDARFHKYTAAGSWYVPMGQIGGGAPGSRPIRFTLGLTAEVGAIVGDSASLARFPFERFWMGGVQFGRPLRGYEETTITPRGYVPERLGSLAERFGDAYVRLSAEYAVRLNDNISLSLFYDAGNVWRSVSDINPMRLMRGAGIGVMLVTPFGPLGLDYAYGFDKDPPGWQFHFKMGPTF